MPDIKQEVDKIQKLIERTNGTVKPDVSKQKQLEERDNVKKAVRVLSSDLNFRLFLRYLAKSCGQFKSSIAFNTINGVIDKDMLLRNESRRTVYLEIRRMLTDEARQLIEAKGEDENGD